MKTCSILSIVIPDNRQRLEHDPVAHEELKTSIEAQQLLHPVVLRAFNGMRYLVAGERRIRAIREMHELGQTVRHDSEPVPDGHIPYVMLGELSPLEAWEAELEENVRRKDLSWQEKARAEAALVALRQAQAKEKGTPIADAMPKAVAELRGEASPGQTQSVARNVILANNLHRPEVRGAKTATDAFKALKRAEDAARNEALAQALGKEFLGGKHRLFNDDCLTWLALCPPATFDVVLSDPIYGMGADEFGDSGGKAAGSHDYDDSYELWKSLLSRVAHQLTAVTKPQAHAYLFCDFDRFHELKGFMQVAGWRVFRTPLLWHKPSAFRAPWPEHGPQRKYECILFAVKGDMKVTKLAPDVITYPPDENLGHQAQKPVALFADLLARSCTPGMQVLDFMCGSGPIFPAAQAVSVVATGIELDPGFYGIAAKRLQGLKGK